MKQEINPDLLETGEKLKKLRLQAKLTQEQLAEKVGGTCTNTVISRYGRGIVEMGILTMYDLAEALQVTPESLIPDRLLHSSSQDPPAKSSKIKTIRSDNHTKTLSSDIQELFSQLDDENQEKAQEYLKMLFVYQQHTSQII